MVLFPVIFKKGIKKFCGGLAVKDLAWSLLWLGSLLWCAFDPWLRNFHMPQAWPKKGGGININGQPIIFAVYLVS